MFFSETGAVDEEFITRQNSIEQVKLIIIVRHLLKIFFFFVILKKNLSWKNDSEF